MKPIAEVMDKFHRTLTQNRTKFLTIELKFSYLICNACNLRNLLPWCNRVALVCQAIRDKNSLRISIFEDFRFPNQNVYPNSSKTFATLAVQMTGVNVKLPSLTSTTSIFTSSTYCSARNTDI